MWIWEFSGSLLSPAIYKNTLSLNVPSISYKAISFVLRRVFNLYRIFQFSLSLGLFVLSSSIKSTRIHSRLFHSDGKYVDNFDTLTLNKTNIICLLPVRSLNHSIESSHVPCGFHTAGETRDYLLASDIFRIYLPASDTCPLQNHLLFVF
jgi:hypothetical protein